MTENDHIPEWSLLACMDGKPVGFVIGNIDLTTNPPGGDVWQIGVGWLRPSWSRPCAACSQLAQSQPC